MSDNPHAHLTGTDLHEPKGVETASVNQVYVADGVGSGAWGLISKSTLADTANPFGSQLFHIREEQTSGSTSAGDVGNRVWSIRTLNTVKTNEISGASLATNQFTLGAGTYYIEAVAPCWATSDGGVSKSRLWNITDSVALVVGTSHYGYISTVYNHIKGRFTLAGTKTLRIESYANTTASTVPGTSASETEVFTDVQIWKVG